MFRRSPSSSQRARLALAATLLAAVAGASSACRRASAPLPRAAAAAPGYDPLARANASYGLIVNREAVIPPQCYTKTEGVSNPCYTCHVDTHFPNLMGDADLQREYSFSDAGRENHWTNLFVDRSAQMTAIPEAAALAYVREDNYSALREALRERRDYAGYRPDLDFARGFDDDGFARDGSGFRAFRYKPFLGAFLPTNGSTDDVLIRLPERLRRKGGREDRSVARVNLAILEASFGSDPALTSAQVRWPVEPLDERDVGRDLDGDGTLEEAITELVGLPSTYVGDGSDLSVRRAIFPLGTEFLHSVRYVDPDAPSLISRRMKELRYMRKVAEPDDAMIFAAYAHEAEEKDEGHLPDFAGHPTAGLRNRFGWQIQGFIEDADGRLRSQTHEETLACMGCHSNAGITLDQVFSFARKVPGAAGWGYQSLEGIPDVPQLGHRDPELLEYFRRVGGGDEFRSNAEVLERFFRGGELDEAEVRRSAVGGDRDLRALVAPSRERAVQLIRAYMLLVREQSFERGRDVVLAPPSNVHRRIETESTGLAENHRTYFDAQLRLDWRGTAFMAAH